MEKLLKTTNKAVQDMNKLLSQTQKMLLKSFDSMESSMDDMVAVQTGETSGQVDARPTGSNPGTDCHQFDADAAVPRHHRQDSPEPDFQLLAP